MAVLLIIIFLSNCQTSNSWTTNYQDHHMNEYIRGHGAFVGNLQVDFVNLSIIQIKKVHY